MTLTLNSLLPEGRYINMDPFILGLLFWTIIFFAKSLVANYNFLTSLQIIINLGNAQFQILDNFYL